MLTVSQTLRDWGQGLPLNVLSLNVREVQQQELSKTEQRTVCMETVGN